MQLNIRFLSFFDISFSFWYLFMKDWRSIVTILFVSRSHLISSVLLFIWWAYSNAALVRLVKCIHIFNCLPYSSISSLWLFIESNKCAVIVLESIAPCYSSVYLLYVSLITCSFVFNFLLRLESYLRRLFSSFNSSWLLLGEAIITVIFYFYGSIFLLCVSDVNAHLIKRVVERLCDALCHLNFNSWWCVVIK